MGDPRNVLFDAALEFGENWRRSVTALAAERLPELSEDERAALATEVDDARSSIEKSVLASWEAAHGRWSSVEAEAATAWARAAYPWMDERNAAHAVSQATYYAWHG